MSESEVLICEIAFGNLEAGKQKHSLAWGWITTNLVDWLYSLHPGWKEVVLYFADSGRPFIKLENNPDTESLRGKVLTRKDFDSVVSNNFEVSCLVHFCDPERPPVVHDIDKETLMNRFVAKLYRQFGDDWHCFETMFTDTGRPAYGIFYNSSAMKSSPRISGQSLKSRIFSQNRAKWKSGAKLSTETIYVLKFTNAESIKVGHTYQPFRNRMYGYLFPNSDSLKGKEICFADSLVIETSLRRPKRRGASLEAQLLQKFKDYKLNFKEKTKLTREFLSIDAYPQILNLVKSGTIPEITKVETLQIHTGFTSADAMRDYNIKRGLTGKAVKFWKDPGGGVAIHPDARED